MNNTGWHGTAPEAVMEKKNTRELTPMMRQYQEARRSLPPNTLLLFRLGDFYEMFNEDAAEAARRLGITLTRRQGTPMAGIPCHAADAYIQKLLSAGKKVAVCDQVEQPRPGHLVKRALTRILTPGTILDDRHIEARKNNYLMALDWRKGNLHAAWLDLTAGEFQIASESAPLNLLPVLTALDPRELVVPRESWREGGKDSGAEAWRKEFQPFLNSRPVNELPDCHFRQEDGARLAMETLGVLNLEGFGLDRKHPALGAAGACLSYAEENLRAKPENVRKIAEYSSRQNLLLDPATLRNLEIFRSAGRAREGSLIAAMDGGVTAAGSRLLERWLASPPLRLDELRRRHQCVGELLEAPSRASELHEYLKGVRDLGRILGRLQNRLRAPRELGGVRDTLRQLPAILRTLAQFGGPALSHLAGRLADFPELREQLEKALVEELPGKLEDGGCIRGTCDEELGRLRDMARNSKNWLAELEARERGRTGIKNLRIRYNQAFGYYIEVTKANLSLVPRDYVRKQTLTNSERFYTPELREKEKEILHAEEKILAREEQLFEQLAERVLEESPGLGAAAAALAELDLLLGWAKLARQWDYCRPDLDEGGDIVIDQGRHPVIEQQIRKEDMGLAGVRTFIPNDTRLSAPEKQIAIITGPNMAGKSTYIRQVALIVLMAQTGAWVPAKRCRVGLVDRIFSRVGASDDLARGNSTFMVEMNETANILNNATEQSLIILDEIGRGTSTYDGLSIAWAVAERLHGEKTSGPRTLFATHYHELTQLARLLPRVHNYCVAVKEWNDEIIFLRQVSEGASDRSYGIQVARLAGLPQSVVERARFILEKLEADDSSHNLLRRRLKKSRQAEARGEDSGQLELF